MPKPRKAIVNLSETTYYHCISRCVRRSYLCGFDDISGQCYEHRRQWIQDQIFFLIQYFSIEVCAFAVMKNHVHLVLSVETEKNTSWSDDEVIRRWHHLYRGSLLSQKYQMGFELEEYEMLLLQQEVHKFRSRLNDISWFMRMLNEHIARRANKEDECTGRFWEGRFKSQPLLDTSALLTCMAYVDLNPVRARLAKNLEDSDHTSIQLRLNSAKIGQQPESLKPFGIKSIASLPKTHEGATHSYTADHQTGLPLSLKDYLELVDATGRVIRDDKPGLIDKNEPKILTKLHMSRHQWLNITQCFESVFSGPVGRVASLSAFYKNQNYKRRVGLTASKRYLEL